MVEDYWERENSQWQLDQCMADSHTADTVVWKRNRMALAEAFQYYNSFRVACSNIGLAREKGGRGTSFINTQTRPKPNGRTGEPRHRERVASCHLMFVSPLPTSLYDC